MMGAINFDGTPGLDISGSHEITANGLSHIAGWPLKALDLSGCAQIDDSALDFIRQISCLEYLNLTSCQLIDDGGVMHLRNLNKLKELSLNWCYNVGDRGCEILGDLDLHSLELMGCEGITDAGVVSILRNKMLRELILPEFSEISDGALFALKSSGVPLVRLDLLNLDKVTDVGVGALTGIGTLRMISLIGLSNVSEEAVRQLRTQLPNAEVFVSN